MSSENTVKEDPAQMNHGSSQDRPELGADSGEEPPHSSTAQPSSEGRKVATDVVASGTTGNKAYNNLDELVLSDDPEHPANMICELCREFYKLGWVTGTGGGISIRHGDIVYLAPSGVQKERIKPEHIFVLPFAQSSVPRPGSKRDVIRRPTKAGLNESACTPLFWNAYTMRAAGACIHTHSQNAVMLTLQLPRNATSFRISHQEMIKGVRIGGVGKTLKFYDTLEVPIIENTADEEDLTFGMAAAMEKYPDAPAILVRRHGVYVWGNTWEQAKTQGECLDYLFEIACKMLQARIPLVGEQ